MSRLTPKMTPKTLYLDVVNFGDSIDLVAAIIKSFDFVFIDGFL
jgi:hypothetical protein